MNTLPALREARTRAIQCGELPWTDEFVRFCDDVEDLIVAVKAVSVENLSETVRDLQTELASCKEDLSKALDDWKKAEDERDEARSKLDYITDHAPPDSPDAWASRVFDLEAKLKAEEAHADRWRSEANRLRRVLDLALREISAKKLNGLLVQLDAQHCADLVQPVGAP